MPRYFLHLDNHDGYLADTDGHELPDDAAAMDEAGKALGATIGEDIAAGRSPSAIRIYVVRADGTRVATLSATCTIERT